MSRPQPRCSYIALPSSPQSESLGAQPRGLRCLKTPESMSKNAPRQLAPILLELLPELRLRDALLRLYGRYLKRHEPAQEVGADGRHVDPVDDHGALDLEGVLAIGRVQFALGVARAGHEGRKQVRKALRESRSDIEDDDAAQARLPFFVLRAFYFGRRLPGRRLPPSSGTPPISPGT